MMLSKQQLEQFEKDGYLVLENFFDPSHLLEEAEVIIDNAVHTQDVTQFQPFPFLACNQGEPSKQNFDYFINSAHGIRLFLNQEINEKDFPVEFELKKKMIREMGNRFGHALHAFNPVFKKFTFSQPIQDVIKSLSFKKPIVCQSMFIMRQDFSSSTDCGHQAATYIHVEPPRKLVSFWLALEDSSMDNGCLQFIPGSHKKGLQAKFIRNPNKEEFEQGKRLVYTSDSSMQKLEDNEYVDVPLKAGWAVLINSLVVHKSAMCSKPMSRDVYAFHVFDSSAKYNKSNWMEFNKETFLPLF